MSFPQAPVLLSLILTLVLIAAVAFDLSRFRIPNLISLLVIVLFLLKAGTSDEAVPWLPHILAFVGTLTFGFLAFATGVFGGGDAKLIAALALWFGPVLLPGFIVITGIVGGCLACVLLLVRRIPAIKAMPAGQGKISEGRGLFSPGAPIPYALPIATAALWLEWL